MAAIHLIEAREINLLGNVTDAVTHFNPAHLLKVRSTGDATMIVTLVDGSKVCCKAEDLRAVTVASTHPQARGAKALWPS